jgi:hypothetical protein
MPALVVVVVVMMMIPPGVFLRGPFRYLDFFNSNPRPAK